MPSLEFGNVQQLIYTDLARNIAVAQDNASLSDVVDLVVDNIDTRRIERDEVCNPGEGERVFMVCGSSPLDETNVSNDVARFKDQLQYWVCAAFYQPTSNACRVCLLHTA